MREIATAGSMPLRLNRMHMKNILIVPGDGIGPEVMHFAKQLLFAVAKRHDLAFNLTEVDWGAERWLREGVGIPAGELEELPKKYDAILFGALGDPRIPDMAHGRAILLGLRTGLDLYINLRPLKLLDPARGVLKAEANVDIVIFRENTQDIYGALGGSLNRGTVDEVTIDESIHTHKGVERIINAAFSYARSAGRGRVTLVDKSNAIKFGGSLWQRVFLAKAKSFPEIKADHVFVDVAAMQMVQNPTKFEVIVTTNLFGDILSDLGAGLIGGLGLAASANINPATIALFEPVHGSAPDIAGKGVANPFAMFLSLGLMFEYFGFKNHKLAIEVAIKEALKGGFCTPDLGGRLTSQEAAECIIKCFN
jgi:3-isopropylmalate dehydrogenase